MIHNKNSKISNKENLSKLSNVLSKKNTHKQLTAYNVLNPIKGQNGKSRNNSKSSRYDHYQAKNS